MKVIYRVSEIGIREVSVPDDYALQAGELPPQPIVVHNPSSVEQLLMQQAQQITVLQYMMMQQNQTQAIEKAKEVAAQ